MFRGLSDPADHPQLALARHFACPEDALLVCCAVVWHQHCDATCVCANKRILRSCRVWMHDDGLKQLCAYPDKVTLTCYQPSSAAQEVDKYAANSVQKMPGCNPRKSRQLRCRTAKKEAKLTGQTGSYNVLGASSAMQSYALPVIQSMQSKEYNSLATECLTQPACTCLPHLQDAWQAST